MLHLLLSLLREQDGPERLCALSHFGFGGCPWCLGFRTAGEPAPRGGAGGVYRGTRIVSQGGAVPILSWHILFFFFLFFFFLGPQLWHMEVPRLGLKSELQLLAYTTGTATRDPSHI